MNARDARSRSTTRRNSNRFGSPSMRARGNAVPDSGGAESMAKLGSPRSARSPRHACCCFPVRCAKRHRQRVDQDDFPSRVRFRLSGP